VPIGGLLSLARRWRQICGSLGALTGMLVGTRANQALAQRGSAVAPGVTEIRPGAYVIADSSGNLLVRVGAGESFVTGGQYPSLVLKARQLIARIAAPPVQFVVATAADHVARFADGGWGSGGATVLAQETLRSQMSASPKEAGPDSGGRGRVPAIGFSEVVQVGLSGDEAHAVHQAGGASGADVIVHLEREHIVFLGALLMTDGYPGIDVRAGGSLDSTIKVIGFFVTNFGPDDRMIYIPGRGPTVGNDGLREYKQMLVTVRDWAKAQLDQKKTLREMIAAGLPATLSAKWEHGPVRAAQFITAVRESLTASK